jgi:hypothetical protein
MKKIDELHNPMSCLNKAADDELVFVLRAKDESACAAVRAWVQDRVRRGLNKGTDGKILEALEWIGEVTWDHESGKWTGEQNHPKPVEEMLQAVKMLRTYFSDCYPPNEHGQIHFARVMVESITDQFESFVNVMQGIAAAKQ